MSCNGCRVLRKGCSESCILRPCLQWIESADAQGHATVFVAKFFGRSGLMGFISAVPPNQRSAVFQSLLYEACGRTVNPVFGAVGLLWSGNWTACQAAVETVLKGGSLRPPSPSSLDAGMTSFPNFSVGNSFAVNLAGLMRSEKSCPTDTSGVSLSNEKSEWAKKAREMYIPSLNDPRCPSELMTAGSHQMQMQGAENNSNVESKAGPDMKGDSAESFSDLRDRHMWRYVATPNSNFPRLELPTVRIASRGLVGVEKQEQDERTDGPLVLAPVARRVRPRTDVPDLRAPSTVPVGRVENEEREKLELDLTLSSNVNATRQQRNGNGAGRAKGVKRVSSPNSSESVNSEGSVTSLDSTCDLSLSQVPDVWKSQKLVVGRPIGFHSPVCSPKALSLFASP